MNRCSLIAIAIFTFGILFVTPALAASRIAIVAAENFYGDIAQQIGGADVNVTSILKNPNEDPHLFEVSPSVARAVSSAGFVIYNGIGYDAWMPILLSAVHRAGRKVIVVAALVGRKRGDNPHVWYDPHTMLALAKTLTNDLGALNPAHRSNYQERLQKFQRSMNPILARVAVLRRRLVGTPVTATEPLFGYMFKALGMQVRNQRFQLAIMNNTEQSASDIAAFENDLKSHRVKLLVYNSQVSGPLADRMVSIAKASNIPVVGATETEPPGKTYQQWIAAELDAVDQALPN